MAYERYKTASAMAQGQKLASLVLKNAKVLDVYNEEWINADVAIHDGVIIGVGNYNGVKEIEGKLQVQIEHRYNQETLSIA